MVVKFKQKCYKCRKNWVITTRRDRYPVCYQCQEKELDEEIKNPEMKKLFDIPDEFYDQNPFLRDIKLNYIRYENLTEKQIEAFKKTVKEMKEAKSSSKDSDTRKTSNND